MTVSPEGDVLHFRSTLLSRMDEWLYAMVPYLILDETGLTGRYNFDLDYERYLEAYSMPGPGAVSYTHLDVYKRQGQSGEAPCRW